MSRWWYWLAIAVGLMGMLASRSGVALDAGTEAVPPDPGQVSDPPPDEWPSYAANGGRDGRVIVLDIEGTIDMGLASYVDRAFSEQRPNDLYLLRIKTFGGRVDSAVRIRDTILMAKAKTVAFVDQRAISAGALISLAADTILMTPSASIGAATPVQSGTGGEMQPTSEKVVSYMRAEMRATAEANNRPADLAEAMVDPDIEVDGVIQEGKLLTLTSQQAVSLGIADGRAADDADVIKQLNWTEARIERYQSHWGEALARFLTGPVVSSLLMTFGFVGLLMELYSPGFGVGGIIGLTCLGLFFFGQYSANLAGWEELLLLGIGIILVALEAFVIQGFTFVGILGGVLIVAALVMALVQLDLPWDVAYDLGYVREAFETAVVRMAVVLAAVMGAGYFVARFAPRSRATSWLVFRAEPAAAGATAGLGAEAPGSSLESRYDDLLGREGVAVTVLRPGGIVDFDGKRVHVVAEGQFVDPQTRVVVVEAKGAHVVVEPVKPRGESESSS